MKDDIQSLVDSAQKNEADAVAELIERLKPLIHAFARRYYFGAESREDLLQEGCLKLLELLGKFDAAKGIPYLGYVKVQLKYFYMEKGKRSKKETSLYDAGDLPEKEAPFIERLPDTSSNVEERLVQTETQMALAAAIKELSAHQRRVILLYYGCGMDMRRIAKQLGVHYQTVVKTKERGLKRLREKLIMNI